MSYLVLARKYRPQNFAQMVGQEHVVQALSNALKAQRLHHAYLFTGTRGVGKTTISRIIAKALNCTGTEGTGGITAEPCGVCRACTEIDAGRYVDYIELDAASNRGVDEISQLLDQAIYKPVLGRFKVYMIDEVHMLSNHAFNAMLKTLEEPPEYLKFVLATTDPQKVPVTVLSRCLQFNLRPMAPETVLTHLQQVLQAENVSHDPGSLKLLARAARGSMRDALSLTDQAIAYGSGALQEDGVRVMLGATDRALVFRLIEALALADGQALLQAIDELRAQGLSAAGVLEDMAEVLQRMAVLQVVPSAASHPDPEAEEMARLAHMLPADETQLAYSMALQGRQELGLAPDEYSGLTMVMLRVLAFKPASAAAAAPPTSSGGPAPRAAAKARAPLVARTSIQAAPASAAPVPPVASATASPVQTLLAPQTSPSTVSHSALSVQWLHCVEALLAQERIAAMTKELAIQSELIEVDEAAPAGLTWVLQIERESLLRPELIAKLQAAVQTLHATVAQLSFKPGRAASSPNQQWSQQQAERLRAAEASLQADPLVQNLMTQFPAARWVAGSIQPTQSQSH